jgi:Protein of unknown function (DUF1570)
MNRSRHILLWALSLGLTVLAAWSLFGGRTAEPSRPGASDGREAGAGGGRGGFDEADEAGEVDGVLGRGADDPGDDDPLELRVTEQSYGVRAPALYTEAEQARHRRQFRGRLARLAQGEGGDAELADCLSLVRWAADKEILDLYGLALRYTLVLHSQSSEARRRLGRLGRSLRRLPVDRAAGKRLLADLGGDFRLLLTPHFRLAYDTEEPFARQIGRLLERVHQAFFRFFAARHFVPVPPADRLEMVIFGSRADYRRATEHLGDHLISTSGVFVSRDNRTYFYDALSEPSLGRSHQNISESVRSVRGFLKDIETGEPGRRFTLTVGGQSYRSVGRARARRLLGAEVRRLQRQRRQIDRRFAGRNAARAVHETVHHLAYAAGIHGRFRKSPTWLVEGLAMYFETVDRRSGQWLGPGAVNKDRRRGFRRDIEARRGVDLVKLVSGDQGFRQSGKTMNRTYNAAWALFHFLVWQHHDALFDLMANLSIEVATERATAQGRRQELTRMFGPLRRLERRWLAFF